MKINCRKIARLASKISVQKFDDEDVTVVNNSPLVMIGKGRQGAVFKISDLACMKVYGETDDCEREYYAMFLGQKTNLLPKVYCKGENFIVMETVYGIDLREYLQSQPLTAELSNRLIQMLITFKNIGYERIDHHKRQIYLQQDGSLKVIDVGRTVWRNRTYPYPRKLLQSLGAEYRAQFIEHVKQVAPELYKEWEHYMQMEELSRRLYHELETKEKVDLKKLRKETNTLLTTKNSKEYDEKLVNLFRKVAKEERQRVEEKERKRQQGDQRVAEQKSESKDKDDKKKDKKVKKDKEEKKQEKERQEKQKDKKKK